MQFLLPAGFLLFLIALSGFVFMPVDKVVFLDVGQGDAILIQHKTSQVLIDGGQGTAVLHRLAEEMPWFDRTIEVLILTHPDQDHLEGLLHVLERYQVKLVVLPQSPHTTRLQEEWLTRLKAALKNNEVDYRFAWQGQTVRMGEVVISILTPFDNGTLSNTNDMSVVTRIDMHGKSFLLTGDAGRRLENMLVQAYGENILKVDILKAGHHGSNTSTHFPLLQKTSPSAAVISVGNNNQYGHPHPLVLERLSDVRVWRTDQHGSVRFTFENNGMYVSSGTDTD